MNKTMLSLIKKKKIDSQSKRGHIYNTLDVIFFDRHQSSSNVSIKIRSSTLVVMH